jgi:ubiquinone/menaquinone biosynthesis C-methylase UbiE
MTALAFTALAIAGLSLIIVFTWRFASRRHSLPCPVWLRWLVELDNPFTETNRARIIIQHLELQPGMNVVDVGCGPGRLTLPIAEQVGPDGEVTAMDIQPGMLRRVQEKAKSAHLGNIRFLDAKAGDKKLETNHYDRALLVTVLGEIPDRERALIEIFKALKPEGVLSVTEVVFDPHFQDRSTVVQLAARVGFRELKLIGNRLAFTENLVKPSRP